MYKEWRCNYPKIHKSSGSPASHAHSSIHWPTTMLFHKTLAFSVAVPCAIVSACAPELYQRDGHYPKHRMHDLLNKRQNLPNPIEDSRGWTFEVSEEWNVLRPEWGICFNGTQQSPIAYESKYGISFRHRPRFNYPDRVVGSYNNWDFGPQFTIDGAGTNNPNLPSMTFEDDGRDETVYFHSWHTHSPAEHTVDGWAPKLELHYVHYTRDGRPRAVIGFLIDRTSSGRYSDFFQQFPQPKPDFRTNTTLTGVAANLNKIIRDADNYNLFYTYRGSLTTPPCGEGIRWYMAKKVLYLNDQEMQEILQVSTFSARPPQPIWMHGVNQ